MTHWLKFLSAVAVLFLASLSARSEILTLEITGHWLQDNFKVTAQSDAKFNPLDPQFDGKVFDAAPSTGELALTLHVNSAYAVFYPAGSQFVHRNGQPYRLLHDFYGYSSVTLHGGSYTFGSASWKDQGILTSLEGPGGSKAALWTDMDISKEDPTRVSFRMFGQAGKLSADLFVGSRVPGAIGRSFLLWEYYAGEEIRSNKYTARITGRPIF